MCVIRDFDHNHEHVFRYRQPEQQRTEDNRTWPLLPQELEERARMSPLIEAYAVESAEFEIGGGSSWPKSLFRASLAKLSPRDYWCHAMNLASTGGYSCTGFVKFLFRLCAIPTSNAAVERRFSAAALEQTALRNRLSATTMEKLLRVGALKEESDKESLE